MQERSSTNQRILIFRNSFFGSWKQNNWFLACHFEFYKKKKQLITNDKYKQMKYFKPQKMTVMNWNSTHYVETFSTR